MAPINLDTLSPKPKRLGQCPTCPYFEAGSAAVCFTCSVRTIAALPASNARCQRCDQRLTDGTCSNYVCGWGSSRGFEWSRAIGIRSGILKAVGDAFKLEGQRRWGVILGRLLVGYLDANRTDFHQFDLIIPSPGWIGRGARLPWDHAAEVLRWAKDAATSPWPVELEPVIVRTAYVPPLKELRDWKARRQRAESELRPALEVVDQTKVRDKRILVYDDIFTDGFTLREVGLKLRAAGARMVCGVTLMRQPYTPRPRVASATAS